MMTSDSKKLRQYKPSDCPQCKSAQTVVYCNKRRTNCVIRYLKCLCCDHTWKHAEHGKGNNGSVLH